MDLVGWLVDACAAAAVAAVYVIGRQGSHHDANTRYIDSYIFYLLYAHISELGVVSYTHTGIYAMHFICWVLSAIVRNLI